MYLFETKIGTCGVDWNEKGIARVVVGARKVKSAEARPPAYVRDAAERIANHLAGKGDDLKDIRVDLSSCPPFAQKVYRALRKVPPGKVITYGDLAKRVGSPNAARAVGRAMATNPVPLIVPCHRIVASSGKLGGFSAPGGVSLKKRLLVIEGSR